MYILNECKIEKNVCVIVLVNLYIFVYFYGNLMDMVNKDNLGVFLCFCIGYFWDKYCIYKYLYL